MDIISLEHYKTVRSTDFQRIFVGSYTYPERKKGSLLISLKANDEFLGTIGFILLPLNSLIRFYKQNNLDYRISSRIMKGLKILIHNLYRTYLQRILLKILVDLQPIKVLTNSQGRILKAR